MKKSDLVKIGKGKNGWYSATVKIAEGKSQTFNQFFDRNEAESWAYAKIRYYWGSEIADKLF